MSGQGLNVPFPAVGDLSKFSSGEEPEALGPKDPSREGIQRAFGDPKLHLVETFGSVASFCTQAWFCKILQWNQSAYMSLTALHPAQNCSGYSYCT